MFCLSIPAKWSAELTWIATVILTGRFGLQFAVEEHESDDLTLEAFGRRLVLNSDYFSNAEVDTQSGPTMPVAPLAMWHVEEADIRNRLVRPEIPVLFGRPGFFVDSNKTSGRLDLDVFGSAYFMLSRIEESLEPTRDMHDRYPATASVAFKSGFLDRPIIDEYVEILWCVLCRIWPQVRRQSDAFELSISHDVDSPSYYAFQPWMAVLRRASGDCIKRAEFMQAYRHLRMRFLSRKRFSVDDPYNTFDWIMDRSDSAGLVSTFYVLCGRTHPEYDADYDVEHPAIRQLIRDIAGRGHRIGLHASYNAYCSSDLMREEAARLRRICASEDIELDELSSRVHYLRWQIPATLQNMEQAGIQADCTPGYADCAGFRCGTCHEYPAFDPIGRKRLNISVRPLVAMESSVMDNRYMGLGPSEAAVETFLALKHACRTVNGTFSLLWHNTQLVDPKKRLIYAAVLAG